jgi:5-formyltetrahydrofolate cyclo-ligase
MSADEAPADEAPADEAPADEAPADEAPADEASPNASLADQLHDEKKRIRAEAFRRRKSLVDRAERSERSMSNWNAVVELSDARCVLYYLSQLSEVETHETVRRALSGGNSVVVPCCRGQRLHLFELRSWDELAIGAYGILEPSQRLWSDGSREVAPSSVDIAMVPGVAFDAAGGRLGHGKGYYDRLLSEFTGAISVGISFELQLFPNVPMASHDIALDYVVTESQVIKVERNR